MTPHKDQRQHASTGDGRAKSRPRAANSMPVAPPRRHLTRRTGRRHNWVFVIVVLAMAGLGVRLVWLQGFNQTAVTYASVSDRLARKKLPAERGVVYDANGTILADTQVKYDITIDPAQIREIRFRPAGSKTTLKGVAAMVPFVAAKLGMSDAELTKILTEQDALVTKALAENRPPSKYFVIAKDIDPITRREIMNYAREHQMPYFSDQKQNRIYPSNEVGANLLGGVTKVEQKPIGGIELSLDKYLKGVDGAETYEQGRLGQAIPGGASMMKAPVNGSNVKLTIQSDIQWKAQQECSAALAKIQGDSCTTVVMKVDTGAIVAMAEAPTYDANKPGLAPVGSLVNRSVSDVFDPGSTGKVITAAAVLEEKKATPATQYTVPYNFTTPNGQKFKDSEEHPDEKLTLAGVLARSSNTGTVQAGSLLPASVRYQYLKKFNMGNKTNVELPGESQGLLVPYNKWDGRMTYTTMFGQGYSVNALQQVSVFATVANGGVRMPAHLVDAITAPDGTVTTPARSAPVQVISPETSTTLMRMLEGVVASGTGKNGAITGYQVAGKTGTAEIFGKTPAYVASFIGVAPANDPQYVVGVFVRKSGALIYGSEVAAPVFSNVMTYVLQQNSVPPSLTPANPFPLTW